MNKITKEEFIADHIMNTMVNHELFAQWLRRFFFLNHELNKEFDSIYQGSFYVSFYELTTVGLDYAKDVLEKVKDGENQEMIDFYKTLIPNLINLKDEFTEEEFEFIEYKRHSFSHIFQHYYENRFSEKDKLITKRKGKDINEISNSFQKILLKYGLDKGFDEYMNKKLYSKINDLYEKLKRVKTHYNNLS